MNGSRADIGHVPWWISVNRRNNAPFKWLDKQSTKNLNLEKLFSFIELINQFSLL